MGSYPIPLEQEFDRFHRCYTAHSSPYWYLPSGMCLYRGRHHRSVLLILKPVKHPLVLDYMMVYILVRYYTHYATEAASIYSGNNCHPKLSMSKPYISHAARAFYEIEYINIIRLYYDNVLDSEYLQTSASAHDDYGILIFLFAANCKT